MRVRTIQCIDVVLRGWRRPSAWACACIALGSLVEPRPTSAQPASTVVSAADQSIRDDERLRVLRDELKKSEALVESLAKRRAERLAVADAVAADEADEQRIRALSDIAGIKREIAAAGPSGKAPLAAATGNPTVSVPKPAQLKGQPTTPWWDVYGKARRGHSDPSLSSAQPPDSTAAQTSSTRRME